MMGEPFKTTRQVRFSQVDAAGIVFYPRYFEMINSVVEDWFSEALDASFAQLILQQDIATPAVRIDAEFLRTSLLGEQLNFSLYVTKLGRSSCQLRIEVSCRAEQRLEANITMVFMHLLRRKAIPIPPDIRTRMERYVVTPEGAFQPTETSS